MTDPSAPGDPGLYGPASITWRLTGETAMLLGGPRALLLQLAHPLVAAGVAQHSTFRDDPLKRLWRTLDATLRIVFGTTSEAEAAAAQINRIHAAVKGQLPESSGRFGAGTPYAALDPELLLWVHATLVDTTLEVYPRFVWPLGPGALERAYQESKTAARILQVPEALLPADLAAFRSYMREMVASDAIAVAPFQRELADAVLYPPILPRPLRALGVAITAGLLPPKVRESYELVLTPGRRRVFEWSARVVRGILPLMPRVARRMPHARRAVRRVGGG
jgi:uncharacterized protein (DUF2236 family)